MIPILSTLSRPDKSSLNCQTRGRGVDAELGDSLGERARADNARSLRDLFRAVERPCKRDSILQHGQRHNRETADTANSPCIQSGIKRSLSLQRNRAADANRARVTQVGNIFKVQFDTAGGNNKLLISAVSHYTLSVPPLIPPPRPYPPAKRILFALAARKRH